MVARLQKIDSSWMAPHALAAELTARAGAATGAGYAALGEGIARGISGIADRRGRKRREAEENKYRLTRQDILDERAADNKRQYAQMQMTALDRQAVLLETRNSKLQEEVNDAYALGDADGVKSLSEQGGAVQSALMDNMARRQDLMASLAKAAGCAPGDYG